jgi:hypothetical protein
MTTILDILNNLIYISMLPIGFALDNLVMILRAPVGFAVVFSSITYFEYSTTKKIIKDVKKINFKKSPKFDECAGECNIPVQTTASLA